MTWLGVADQDFTNIWTGTANVSTASQFHSAVDGVGPTFSIYGITFDNGDTGRVGGYTKLSWGGARGYHEDSSAFIFNLDSLEVQSSRVTSHSIWRAGETFSEFGPGRDLGVDSLVLGGGESFSAGYGNNLGQITIVGDSGRGYTNTGSVTWVVNSLEVYTFDSASPVPVPTALWLFGSALVGLVGMRKQHSK